MTPKEEREWLWDFAGRMAAASITRYGPDLGKETIQEIVVDAEQLVTALKNRKQNDKDKSNAS
jgi:hypothetical protein